VEGGFKTRRLAKTLIVGLALSGLSVGTVQAATQTYHSTGTASFYDSQDPSEPGQPDPSLPGTGGDGEEGGNNGGNESNNGNDHNSGNESNNTNKPETTKPATPNHNAAGQAILPQTGDQNLSSLGVIGMALLMILVLILNQHTKERIHS